MRATARCSTQIGVPAQRGGQAASSLRCASRMPTRPFIYRGDRLISSPCHLEPCKASTYQRDLSTAPRLIQHKNEAKAFYAFLSQVYDYIVNPGNGTLAVLQQWKSSVGDRLLITRFLSDLRLDIIQFSPFSGHWTVEMRTEALLPGKLDNPDLKVVDVGGGTGFCTQGIVRTVDPANVTLLDQSPQQLAKARGKADLKGVTIMEGDAEELPFEADTFDRYVSAGSIEYWPEPQRGICEAYRVIKPGGLACIIGPVHPTFWLSRFFADVWMLFPTEAEYKQWFENAGFEDVKLTRIGPKWYRGVRRHGLIMGCSVTGVKRKAGASPLELAPKSERSEAMNTNPLAFVARLVLGSAAGFYYFLLPVYMWLKNLVWPKSGPLADKF